VLGTSFVGLFAQDGIGGISSPNGLFFGGGFELLGIQTLGVVCVGGFVFAASMGVWFLLKKTMGIRVSEKEEIEGLDIGEHGNQAYPDFVTIDYTADHLEFAQLPVPETDPGTVPVEVAVPVRVVRESDTAKFTKVEIITKQNKFEELKNAMDKIGITGMTVTNVLGYGVQGGTTEYYRGIEFETHLLPKIKVEIVVSKVPVRTVIETAKKVLYTGNIGDGKIFVYDVENVSKYAPVKKGMPRCRMWNNPGHLTEKQTGRSPGGNALFLLMLPTLVTGGRGRRKTRRTGTLHRDAMCRSGRRLWFVRRSCRRVRRKK
jgi:Amt family ammonium transporter